MFASIRLSIGFVEENCNPHPLDYFCLLLFKKSGYGSEYCCGYSSKKPADPK